MGSSESSLKNMENGEMHMKKKNVNMIDLVKRLKILDGNQFQ
jgi:hypothetical protein